MRHLLVIASVVLAAPLAAQELPVSATDCKTPKPPLGAMTARAVVQYRLPTSGRLDSTTFAVLSVEGASAIGFRHAILRQLTVCKLGVGGPGVSTDTWVRQEIVIDSTTIQMTTAFPLQDNLPPPSPASTEAIDPSTAYALSSLDERPRLKSCKRAKGLYSRSQAPDMSSQGSWIRVQYQVDAMGKVDPEQITFRDVGNPATKARAIAYYASCRFVPGRIGGIAVGTYLDADTWFDASGFPRQAASTFDRHTIP